MSAHLPNSLESTEGPPQAAPCDTGVECPSMEETSKTVLAASLHKDNVPNTNVACKNQTCASNSAECKRDIDNGGVHRQFMVANSGEEITSGTPTDSNISDQAYSVDRKETAMDSYKQPDSNVPTQNCQLDSAAMASGRGDHQQTQGRLQAEPPHPENRQLQKHEPQVSEYTKNSLCPSDSSRQQINSESCEQSKETPSQSDGCEHVRHYVTEDEGSDWEGPVDVELEESPQLVRRSHAGRATWSTMKALTRWLPRPRSRRQWTQMSGHQGSFLAGDDGVVLKLLVTQEETNLRLLMDDVKLRPHVPRYLGSVSKDGVSYVQLQDLLCEFSSPCVMDIKMGVRTYLEEELDKARKKPTLRKDMYQKMVSVDPAAPTAEERQQQAVTKPRYMKFRDDMSSSSLLGFRIEGIKTRKGASKDYKDTRTRQDVIQALLGFVEENKVALRQYTSVLGEICKDQDCSNFLRSHEMVGSSLLFVHDHSGKAGVWMIDFAKCCPLPVNVSIDHRSPWTPGNFEDGYLFGLDNLQSIFQELEAVCRHSD